MILTILIIITLNKVKSETNCIKNDYCDNQDEISKIAYKNDSLFLNRNCYCDDNCYKYGDCCPDKENNDIYFKYSRSFKCLLERRVCSTEKVNSYIYSIGDCPNDYIEDDEIRVKCEKSNYIEQITFLSLNNDDIFLQWPFYSNQTNITYNNIYCGLCNGENKNYLQPWNAAFRCNENVNKQIKNTSDKMDEIKNNCVFVKWMSNYMQFRYCRRQLISTCLKPTGDLDKDKINSLKCTKGEYKITYSTNFKTGELGLFRNKFCAECSGYKAEEEFVCNRDTLPVSKYRCSVVEVTWSVIFDFNFFTGEYRVGFNKFKNELTTNKCEQDYFYDPFTKMCRAIALGKTKAFINLDDCKSTKSYESNEYTLLNDNFKTEERSLFNSTLSTQTVFLIYENVILNSSYYKLIPDNGSLITCAIYYNPNSNKNEKFSNIHEILTIIGIALSLFGLSVLLIIYILFPTLRNLPGKNLICLCISFVTVYLTMIASILIMKTFGNLSNAILASNNTLIKNKESPRTKYDWLFYTIAVFLHYAFLCTFSWTSIIAFDICRTFLVNSYYSACKDKDEQNKIFKYHLIIGFGVIPVIPVILALVADLGFNSSSIAPRYGGIGQTFRIAWFSNRLGLLVFYIIPVALMYILNLVFFILTVVSILKTDANTAQTITSKSASTNQKNASMQTRVFLFLKLLILMGLSWVLAFMASMIDQNWIYIINTVVNAFQGFFIAITFIFNKKVLGLIRSRLQSLIVSTRPIKNNSTNFLLLPQTSSLSNSNENKTNK